MGHTITSVVVYPLGIEDVVHGDHVIVFAQRTTAHSPEFLHVPTDTKQETEMHAERTNVRAGFA